MEAAGGGDIINKGGFKGEAPFSDTRVTPGPYNSGERFKDASTGFHVTKYENCGLQKPVS